MEASEDSDTLVNYYTGLLSDRSCAFVRHHVRTAAAIVLSNNMLVAVVSCCCFPISLHTSSESLSLLSSPLLLPLWVTARSGCFFFVVAPFCSCPASRVSRKFFAVGPGVQSVFFFVALRWASRRGQSKKKHHPGCFFFCSGLGRRHGARAKKKTPPRVFFFLLRPRGKAGEGEAPLGAGTGPEQKKKHHPGCFFFAPALGAGTGPEQKKTPPRVIFFLLRPRGKARRSPLGASAGPEQKKKTPPRVFFFCSGPGERQGKEKPRWAPARGQSKKKNTTQGVFFLLRPWAPARGQSKKKNTTQGVFFLLRPRGKRQGKEKLRWAPARGQSKKKKHHPGCVFFDPALGAGTGPEQKKKKHHPGCFFFGSGPGERQGKEKPRWAPARGQSKKKKNRVFFFLLRPWAPARGQSKKKNTTQGVFFFAPAPGKGRGRRSFVGRRHGARAKKKKHHPGCFFLIRPWAPARGQSKKKTPPRVFFFAPALGAGTGKKTPPRVFFFAPAPGKGRGRRSFVGRRHGARAKKKHHPGCFFLIRPWAPARGQSKIKTPPRVCVCVCVFFFLLRPRRKAGEGEASLGAGTGPEQKKKNTQGVFVFFAAAPTKGRRRWTPRPFGGARTKKNHDPGCVFWSGPAGWQGKENG